MFTASAIAALSSALLISFGAIMASVRARAGMAEIALAGIRRRPTRARRLTCFGPLLSPSIHQQSVSKATESRLNAFAREIFPVPRTPCLEVPTCVPHRRFYTYRDSLWDQIIFRAAIFP